jgi:hypothetical protein
VLLDASSHLRTAAVQRCNLKRHPSERFLNVHGGTREQVTAFIVDAAVLGVTLRLAPGPLLRATRACAGERARAFTHMPLSTGSAGSTASQLFRAAATKMYMRAGMSRTEAARRTRVEPWTSHGGRRGSTTEIKARLAKFKAQHPELMTEDMTHLVNLHMGWVDEDLTTQDHYTGMRNLEEILLITLLL